jgi:2-phospho-L-lactate guanylyltransferase (CobY/MobA/RfbA family)
VVIAPADARNGTNALLLSPPSIIEPQFGLDSFAAHLRAAAVLDASVQIVDDPLIGFDLDTPDDLDRVDLERRLELENLGAQIESELVLMSAG